MPVIMPFHGKPYSFGIPKAHICELVFYGSGTAVMIFLSVGEIGGVARVRYSVAALALFVLIACAQTIPPIASAASYFETFASLSNWKIFRGQSDPDALIDRELGQNAPSLMIPPASSLKPDPPGFGDGVTSLYLRNPNTSTLSNFTLDFWMYFDDDVGRAIITFRMQDERNYYAILITDTHDWEPQVLKFKDDRPIVLDRTTQGFFSPQKWHHLKLRVQGQGFLLTRDYDEIMNATDREWMAGRNLGIGIYNGFDSGTFHIDTMTLSTPEPLTYDMVITQTAFVTETMQTTTTQTFEASTTSTTTIVNSLLVTIRTTTEVSYTAVRSISITNTIVVELVSYIVNVPSFVVFFVLGSFVGGLVALSKPKDLVLVGALTGTIGTAIAGYALAVGIVGVQAAIAFGVGIIPAYLFFRR